MSTSSLAQPRLRRGLVFGAILFAGISLAVFAPIEHAHADSFGTCNASTGTGCQADDANQDFCTVYAWDTTYGNRFMDAMANLDAQTDMYDTYQSTCGSQTDVGGYLNQSAEMASPLGPTVRGAWLCTKKLAGSNIVCDQGSLTINTNVLGTDASQIRKTICHEVGHSVGLTHHPAGSTNVGCMISGSSTSVSYSSHHVTHINTAY